MCIPCSAVCVQVCVCVFVRWCAAQVMYLSPCCVRGRVSGMRCGLDVRDKAVLHSWMADKAATPPCPNVAPALQEPSQRCRSHVSGQLRSGLTECLFKHMP